MNILIWLIILLVILIFVIILKFLRVKNLKIYDWVQVEFWPIHKTKDVYIKTMDKIGFVVSQDGKVYKIHLKTSLKSSEEISLNNVQLFISGIGWFVFRQFFKETDTGNRVPYNQSRVFNKNKVNEINIEFEPQEGWNPLSLSMREYKSLLKVVFLNKIVKQRFKFKVRNQNLEVMKKSKENLPIVIEVPIIKN